MINLNTNSCVFNQIALKSYRRHDYFINIHTYHSSNVSKYHTHDPKLSAFA
jgi:hypothetical protein